MTSISPPQKIVPMHIASDKTKELLTKHNIYAVQLHNFHEELKIPALLCYCRCKEHTNDPWTGWIPFSEVILTVPFVKAGV